MRNVIELRVIGFHRHNTVHLLCLDTDIAVRANSIEEAKRKMVDAMTCYLTSFSKEEIVQGKFLRYSPARYRFLWRVGMLLGFLRRLMQTFSTTYDPHSGQVKFA